MKSWRCESEVNKAVERSVSISEMAGEEKELVRQLLVECYVQYKQNFEQEVWEKYFSQVKCSLENEKIDKLYVAKYRQEVVGTIQLFRSSDEAYEDKELDINAPIIRFLAVHQKWQGLGTARKLIDTAVSYTKHVGADAVYLHTSDAMERAIHLYETYGFIRDVSQDYQNGENHIKCYKYMI